MQFLFVLTLLSAVSTTELIVPQTDTAAIFLRIKTGDSAVVFSSNSTDGGKYSFSVSSQTNADPSPKQEIIISNHKIGKVNFVITYKFHGKQYQFVICFHTTGNEEFSLLLYPGKVKILDDENGNLKLRNIEALEELKDVK